MAVEVTIVGSGTTFEVDPDLCGDFTGQRFFSGDRVKHITGGTGTVEGVGQHPLHHEKLLWVSLDQSNGRVIGIGRDLFGLELLT